MGSHVVGLGRRGVVGVAANVAVEVVLGQLVDGGDLCEAVDIGEFPVRRRDLLFVPGAQVILGTALAVVAIGVDEQHLASSLGRLRTLGSQNQDRSGDASSIEQIRAETDDRVEQVVLDDLLTDGPFDPASEQHPVWHDRGDDAVVLEDRQHVLQEHEVGFLAALRGVAVVEPLGVGERVLVVVLAERRVGDDTVEPLQLAAAGVLGVGERVVVLEVGVSDAVQQHVHLRDRPCGAVVLLPGQYEIGWVAAVVDDVVAGVDQHAARS